MTGTFLIWSYLEWQFTSKSCWHATKASLGASTNDRELDARRQLHHMLEDLQSLLEFCVGKEDMIIRCLVWLAKFTLYIEDWSMACQHEVHWLKLRMGAFAVELVVLSSSTVQDPRYANIKCLQDVR